MNICLVGPCAPEDVLKLMFPTDSEEAGKLTGFRGVPVSSLAVALIESRHNVTLVTTSDDVTSVRKFKGPNFTFIIVPQRRRARYLAFSLYVKEIIKMRDILIALDVDIINAHWTYEHAIAALMTGKKCVVTAHDAPWLVFKTAGSKKFWVFRFFLAWICRLKSKHIIFVSEDLQRKWRQEMRWRKASTVISNLPPFGGSASCEQFGNEPVTKILSVGDSSPRKNIQASIDSYRLLKSAQPELELHLVGVGLEMGAKFYNLQIKDFAFPDIHWHGYQNRDDFMSLMKSCHVLVQPSLLESFGLTLLEAMSLGVSVIAGHNTGAAVEVVGDAGILVDTRNIDEIVDALESLMKNPHRRNELRRKAKLRVDRDFAQNKIIDLTLSTYEKIISSE